MTFRRRTAWLAPTIVVLLMGVWVGAQQLPKPLNFEAIAVLNNNLGSGAGRVDIRVTRWSTAAERKTLVDTLLNVGPQATLDKLIKMKPVGFIRTPDSLAYDLRYSAETPLPDGGRRITLATDRPIGFWELVNQPLSIRYPFTVIEMQINKDGTGKGTLSIATKISAHGNTIELENFGTAPVMLTEIHERQ